MFSLAAIATLWDDGKHYDYVINLAAETKYGHNDEVYRERVKHLSLSCAAEAVKHNIRRFIEVSTAQVYEPTNKPKSESGALDPWTNIAKFKLEVEQGLKDISGLNYVIVRPAIVYGPGDKSGVGKSDYNIFPHPTITQTHRAFCLGPRIICGAIYKHLDKPMKLLWNADLKLNTVHVHDVVRALWHLTTHGESGAIYNLADKNDTGK